MSEEVALKPGLKLSVFDDMTVLADPSTGSYYTFNPVAGAVVESIATCRSACAATRGLMGRYSLDEEAARADVGDVIEGLRRELLLAPEGAPAIHPAPAPRPDVERGSRGHVVVLQEIQHLYPLGGSAKLNRWYMEQLVAAGYDVSVFCDIDTPITRAMLGCLWSQDTLEPAPQRYDDAVEFWVSGVRLLALTENDTPTREQVERLEPTALILSEDRMFGRHEVGFSVSGDVPTMWLATRPATLPFGRHAWNRSPEATELFMATDEVVVPNVYMAEYVKNWTGRETRIIPSRPFTTPRAELGPHDGFVTLVNPSEIKGISVFLGLADKLPHRRFAAVPGWSTTEDDLARLRERPNVTLLRPSRDIATVLESTSVLLNPALWPESPGLLVAEAMLRSIPTAVSIVGALPEVKLGTDHLLPVSPIEEYTGGEDGRGVAVPVIPSQKPETIDAWADVVERLMSDRDHWERVAHASHAAALTQAEAAEASSLEPPLSAMLERRATVGVA